MDNKMRARARSRKLARDYVLQLCYDLHLSKSITETAWTHLI